MSIVNTYTNQQLAACGFVLNDSTVAVTLRPDLFPDGMAAAYDFSQARKTHSTTVRGKHQHLSATLEGFDKPIPLLARTQTRLAERITEATGFVVIELADERPAAPAPQANAQAESKQRQQDARLASIKALAAQELQSYECNHNKQVRAARAELKERGARA